MLFEGLVTFGVLNVLSDFKIKNCNFKKEVSFILVSFRKKAKFENVTFNAAANFRHVTFLGETEFQFNNFNGTAFFDSAQFLSGVNFFGSIFNGSAHFNSSLFNKEAKFTFVKFHQKLEFNVRIMNRINFSDTTFTIIDWGFNEGQKLNFKNIQFGIPTYYYLENPIKSFSKAIKNSAGINKARVIIFGFPLLPVFILIHFFRLIIIRLRSAYGWEWVRTIGELTILTRASYISIILVPIIAALWGPLNNTISWWDIFTRNSAVEFSRKIGEGGQEFTGALQAFRGITENLQESLNEISKKLNNLDKKFDKPKVSNDYASNKNEISSIPIIEKQENENSKEINLSKENSNVNSNLLYHGHLPEIPLTITLLFFASIAVTFGHFFYQLWAPELVKRKSREEYISLQMTRFLNDKTDAERKNHLRNSLHYLRDLGDLLPHSHHRNLVKRYGEAIYIPSDLELFFKDPVDIQQEREHYYPSLPNDFKSLSKNPDVSSSDSKETQNAKENYPDQERMLITIDEGAKAEYEINSKKYLIKAICAGIFYFFAGVFILGIFYIQAISISNHTNWGWP